jgi:hypothetical protein
MCIRDSSKGSVVFKNALIFVNTSSGGVKPRGASKPFVISGFAAGKAVLTNAMKLAINKYVVANKSYRTINCVGYTMGPTRSATDVRLSKARALAACNYAVVRNKSLKIAKLAGIRETKLGAQVRRILITFTN